MYYCVTDKLINGLGLTNRPTCLNMLRDCTDKLTENSTYLAVKSVDSVALENVFSSV